MFKLALRGEKHLTVAQLIRGLKLHRSQEARLTQKGERSRNYVLMSSDDQCLDSAPQTASGGDLSALGKDQPSTWRCICCVPAHPHHQRLARLFWACSAAKYICRISHSTLEKVLRPPGESWAPTGHNAHLHGLVVFTVNNHCRHICQGRKAV